MEAITHSHARRLAFFLLFGTLATAFGQVRLLHSLERPYSQPVVVTTPTGTLKSNHAFQVLSR